MSNVLLNTTQFKLFSKALELGKEKHLNYSRNLKEDMYISGVFVKMNNSWCDWCYAQVGLWWHRGKWCIYIVPLSKALYRDCALHSPIHTHIHTPMVKETMQGTNLLIGNKFTDARHWTPSCSRWEGWCLAWFPPPSVYEWIGECNECVCEWVNVMHNLCKAPWLKTLNKCTIYQSTIYWGFVVGTSVVVEHLL